MQDNVIVVDTLHKHYGNITAVADVSFAVRRGEIYAFLGPNGAGKTTVVEILECLRSPTSGSVSLMGLDTRRNAGKIKSLIGVLPQSFSALDWLTVWENLDYFAHLYPKHVDIDALIEMFGLTEKRNIPFKQLSGGQKQRVGIAISLVSDPEIVFLDEPTTGLDPKARRDVWEAIKALKTRGKTVFLTTHFMDEAYYLADRIAVLHKGRIIAEGRPEELINQYGGGNTLVVRDCDEAALKLLSREIGDSRIEGSDVLAVLPSGDGMASLTRAVSLINTGNLTCKEIYVKKPTLEDVFLHLTGEKLAPAEAPKKPEKPWARPRPQLGEV